MFRNLFEGANTGDAVLRNAPWLKWVVMNIGDPLYRPFPNGRAPFNTARLENALTLTPRSLIGGGGVSATVSLHAPAPAGGAAVMLSSGSTSVATMPASVTVPAGATTAAFVVSTRSTTVWKRLPSSERRRRDHSSEHSRDHAPAQLSRARH
jgi:hypothetical protein